MTDVLSPNTSLSFSNFIRNSTYSSYSASPLATALPTTLLRASDKKETGILDHNNHGEINVHTKG
jgi:hypothetical protein